MKNIKLLLPIILFSLTFFLSDYYAQTAVWNRTANNKKIIKDSNDDISYNNKQFSFYTFYYDFYRDDPRFFYAYLYLDNTFPYNQYLNNYTPSYYNSYSSQFGPAPYFSFSDYLYSNLSFIPNSYYFPITNDNLLYNYLRSTYFYRFNNNRETYIVKINKKNHNKTFEIIKRSSNDETVKKDRKSILKITVIPIRKLIEYTINFEIYKHNLSSNFNKLIRLSSGSQNHRPQSNYFNTFNKINKSYYTLDYNNRQSVFPRKTAYTHVASKSSRRKPNNKPQHVIRK